MSDMIRHTPSAESLKLAVEFCKSSRDYMTAGDVLRTAALFEGYLLGGFIPNVSAHNLDGNIVALGDIIRRLPDPNILNIGDVALGGLSGGDRTHNVPDESVSAPAVDAVVSAHSSSPNASENARTDSTSDAGTKTVAPYDLTNESLPLLQLLTESAHNPELRKEAINEINKRRGVL